MRRRDPMNSLGILLAIVLWMIFMIAIGFAARANWQLILIGWNLLP